MDTPIKLSKNKIRIISDLIHREGVSAAVIEVALFQGANKKRVQPSFVPLQTYHRSNFREGHLTDHLHI